MKTKTINTVVSVCFIVILAGFMLASVITPDLAISIAERRRLETFPEFTWSNIVSGKFFSEFEDYALDHFVLRDEFRSLKAFAAYKLLWQKDNNGYFIYNDGIYEIEHKYNESSVINAADIYKKLASQLFANANVFYTVVPDKNYFVADAYGCESIDYDRLFEVMGEQLDSSMNYIDVAAMLAIEDYYRTDLHWDQSKIIDVANRISLALGGEGVSADKFQSETLTPFYGSYYGPAAVKIKGDTLTYLTNDILNGCKVYDCIKDEYSNVYVPDKFGGTDSYDVFLSGAKEILRIENPANTSGKELFVVRDSYGSSLIPLLVEDYSTVTVIDLRYIKMQAISRFITVPEGADVLFMYNTLILNNSGAITQ